MPVALLLSTPNLEQDSARNEKVILSRVVYNKAVISLAKSGR